MTIAERLGRSKESRHIRALGQDAYMDASKLIKGRRDEQGSMPLWRRPENILIGLLLALASATSFGLGLLAGREEEAHKHADDGFWIEKLEAASAAASSTEPAAVSVTGPLAAPSAPRHTPKPAATAQATAGEGSVVASKTGTAYYLPWCSAAKRIKPENKVTYASRAAAEAAGLTPAKNCKGL